MDRQIVSMLGICRKAGHLRVGSFSSERAIRDGSAALVLVSEGASGGTKKKFSQKAFHYRIPYKELAVVGDFGRTEKADTNATVSVITCKNLSAKILSLMGVDSG